jgi:3-oxoacyl-(acyl-carrier-protein) synthase
LLTTNKWKIGHTFGASGMLSIELAILMMQHQQFIPVPYLDNQFIPVPYLDNSFQTSKINRVLVNAVGFGGNAVSILLKQP